MKMQEIKFHIKKIGSKIIYFYRCLFFSGLEIMCILFGIRPIRDAVEEYEQVKNMGLVEGYIQMFVISKVV